MSRILAPGGLLIVTTHGDAALNTIRDSKIHQAMFMLAREDVTQIIDGFEETPFVFRRLHENVLRVARVGSDYGNTFIHPRYVREHWENDELRVVTHLPGGLRGWQDIVIMQRR
jgi:hypothetical protein